MAEVKVGNEFQVKIETVGKKGDGIAKVDDYVIFVPNASEGDVLDIKITKILEKVAFAENKGVVKSAVTGENVDVAEATQAEEPETSDEIVTEDAAEPEAKAE